MPLEETFLGVMFAEDIMRNLFFSLHLINNFKFIVQLFSLVM